MVSMLACDEDIKFRQMTEQRALFLDAFFDFFSGIEVAHHSSSSQWVLLLANVCEFSRACSVYFIVHCISFRPGSKSGVQHQPKVRRSSSCNPVFSLVNCLCRSCPGFPLNLRWLFSFSCTASHHSLQVVDASEWERRMGGTAQPEKGHHHMQLHSFAHTRHTPPHSTQHSEMRSDAAKFPCLTCLCSTATATHAMSSGQVQPVSSHTLVVAVLLFRRVNHVLLVLPIDEDAGCLAYTLFGRARGPSSSPLATGICTRILSYYSRWCSR
jgi:hypothetical protein